MGTEKKTTTNKLSASFKVGAIALAFLIIGYQVALFVHSAAVARLESHRDAPDTVYVVSQRIDESISRHDSPSMESPSRTGRGQSRSSMTVRHDAVHSERADAIIEKAEPRRVESFPFDPNTVSIHDLRRLGFSEKQAMSIDNYRSKGGRYRRPDDFAKSYVVADSVFERLRPFIRIPRTDLNAADSAAFDALPGIGPYFASKMVSYRQQLGGYSYPEQLLDIYNFDEDRYNALKDLIVVGPSDAFPLWTASEEELSRHPYVGKHAAHGIVLYRDNNPRELWTVAALEKAGILRAEDAVRLSRCRIEEAF